jgi:hypothetical protein
MSRASHLAALLIAAIVAFPAQAQQSRHEEVARKGAGVMPFVLTRTRHLFVDKPSGGTQTVTANDKRDRRQIELIRSHLQTEAQRFARGDFSDPAAIHGVDMPGLTDLASAGRKLGVTYRSVPAGASITFTSKDAAIVGAIHQWFAAQRSDHDAHAHVHQ